jgi:hypothetical protein
MLFLLVLKPRKCHDGRAASAADGSTPKSTIKVQSTERENAPQAIATVSWIYGRKRHYAARAGDRRA